MITVGLLAVHSLSKRSNLAGYRAGFVAGDPKVVGELLAVRKHAGMMVPRPVQQAMIALLDDHDHVEQQRVRYQARRAQLRPALEAAGFRIEHSQGSIYLWATRGEDRAGPRSTSSPAWASWWLPATSTARRRRSTSASPSPPPTSALLPPAADLSASQLAIAS